MSLPVLSVLVPTRERADTLLYTLKTLVSQEYENLEIIVSDNASADNTREVVSSFNDSRIKYFNTGKRLGMSQNWEFGLSKVTGEYLSVLGDDDGFLPHAMTDVSRLLVESQTKALIWKKAAYDWPGIPGVAHRLSFYQGNEIVEINSRLLLWLIANAFTSYGRLPVLYSGFVAINCINSIKDTSGEFFHSNTPDVYSGIVLANAIDKYLYSLRPFSINGGSRHSNGISGQKDATREVASRFFNETGQAIHREIPIIQGSIASYVAESFLQAFDRGLTRGINLNKKRYLTKIFRELLNNDTEIRNAGLEKLGQLKIPPKLARELSKKKKEYAATTNAVIDKAPAGSFVNNDMTIDCDSFPVSNIYDAANMLGSILGKYIPPEKWHRFTLFSLIITAASRFSNKTFFRNRLPF